MQEKAMKEKEQKAKEYEQYVKQVTPTHSLPMNMAKAFFVGGLICVIGQAILNVAGSYGLDQETAGSWCSLILIFVSVPTDLGLIFIRRLESLRGLEHLYRLPGLRILSRHLAIEYQKEGQVFGIGCKIFTIAGPVILYGIFSSWLLGVVYYILQWIGVIG